MSHNIYCCCLLCFVVAVGLFVVVVAFLLTFFLGGGFICGWVFCLGGGVSVGFLGFF